MATVPSDTLVTEDERNEWRKNKNDATGVTEDFNCQRAHDTVGAVAVDSSGNVACATSTGGLRYKMVGRVGDSPIVGKSLADASQLSLQYMGDRVHGAGGAIVVSPSGQWAVNFTTDRLAWAAVDHDGLWNLKMSAVIVVHGGAWAIPQDLAEACVDGVKVAACEGFSVLQRGGSALDAVEAAVRALEDNAVFNAGHGAVLNVDGEIELDASIMDGRTLACGAVSSVKNIANPVSLARAVMEKSIGMATVPSDTLVSEKERKAWRKNKTYTTGVTEDFGQRAHDTVGAVAVDSSGNVACATSTGGIRNKMVGRVGDSPIIGESLADASQLSLQYMGDRVHGAGGAIVVSPSGQWAATFTTGRMAWAAVDHDGLWYGIDPNERLNEQLSQ
ncbi:Isoaspartyl peptidase/L-asparaginase [Liparis tanakae]|uniref:Isoaspartyl peptidase/L-asparaginase n=1 Tax=Liparis tanakae TaxID=230148 RepID=A0A4Z2HQG7_9TELE|nr:Isoaspartyl peptidase/L-asparaginase [Liparis tanakae]